MRRKAVSKEVVEVLELRDAEVKLEAGQREVTVWIRSIHEAVVGKVELRQGQAINQTFEARSVEWTKIKLS